MIVRKNLLFITPVIPSITGRGRNLRAFQWVSYLSRKYDVSVLYTGKADENLSLGGGNDNQLKCRIYKLNIKHTPFQRLKKLVFPRPAKQAANGKYFGEDFHQLRIPRPDVILSFRLFNASLALQIRTLWNVKETWLDLDELDSRTKINIIKLKLSARYFKDLPKSVLVALRYVYKETVLISQFDKVFTSTEKERAWITKKFNLKLTDVFENRLPFQKSTVPSTVNNEAFTFLFVGNSGYFPNRDAIDIILFKIIPELKKLAKQPFKFVIIGGGVGNRQSIQIKNERCIHFYRDVDDLELIYNRINAVIVPLRAGGGSSLKFLEALRHRKPVVASAVGIRGFDIKDGEQALIGCNEKELAQKCNALMENRNLYEKLSETGYQWFIENNSYSIEGVEEQSVS